MAYVEEVRAVDLFCGMCGWRCEVAVTEEAPVHLTGDCPYCLRMRGHRVALSYAMPQVYDSMVADSERWRHP